MKRVLSILGIIVLMSGCQSAPEENLVTVPQETPLVEPAPVIPKKVSVSKSPLKPQFISLEEREKKHISEALEMMGNSNPGFKKDLVDDDYRLEMVQDSLHQPIELVSECDMLDEKWRRVETMAAALQIQIDQLGKWWVVSQTENAPLKASGQKGINVASVVSQCPQELRPILERLLPAIEESRLLLDKAFNDLTPEHRKHLIKNIIPQMLLDSDKTKEGFQIEAEKVKLQLALPGAQTVTQGRDVISPEDVAMLRLAFDVNFGYLHQAGTSLASAVDDAIEMLKAIPPERLKQMTGRLLYANTPYGPVIINGAQNDVCNEDALLIIDLGGNDRYLNHAGGSVNGISVLIDLSGDDDYVSVQKFSQGAGLFGIGILADLSGSDTYQAGSFSQGAGLFGIGILADSGPGADTFSADTFCQGAGGWGIGILADKLGDTRYCSRTFSQGLGCTLGTGALIDYAGDDYYISTGTIQNDRPYSMSQGFGQGNRPIASGGVGTLIDYQGNDHYSACFYAQGCAYWYGLGILIDNNGNDRYDAQVYAQGCGIHLSTGVLIDRNGADFYNCTYGGNAQGAAHDLAVGILVDKNGTDTYVGKGNNQGSAITNSFALFIDDSGDDVYYTTPKGGQGFGGSARSYGSMGIFLDLSGNDFYSEQYLNEDGKTGNNKKWLRGDKGVGIDTE
ncbi:MAG: hypothetical protein HZA49_08730 [Planctomycetes bacterium]|nr:hypothetical protein [Planctomycetota bacterium]